MTKFGEATKQVNTFCELADKFNEKQDEKKEISTDKPPILAIISSGASYLSKGILKLLSV